MKTTILRAVAITLLLGTQIFAQRFTSAAPDTIKTGFHGETKYGYFSDGYQSAVLGKKNSIYANLLLLKGLDTLLAGENEDEAVGTYNIVSSYGDIWGVVLPLTDKNVFVTSTNDTVYDGIPSGVVVLDSMSNGKKNAVVVFATLRKVVILKIELNDANKVEQTILSNFNLFEYEITADSYYRSYRQLALLGISQNSNGKVYHLATGNPSSPNGTYSNAGRVDFFSVAENYWNQSLPNTEGIHSGTNGLFFEKGTWFGKNLVSVGDLDKNGFNDLAVLASKSDLHPQSAIYIFFMDNEYTPSEREPVVLTGNSPPWKKSALEYGLMESGLSEHSQNCNGLSFVEWKGEGHLLVSCSVSAGFENFKDSVARSVVVKDLVLNGEGYISQSTTLFAKNSGSHSPKVAFGTSSIPLPIANHRNGDAVSLIVNGPASYSATNWLYSIPVIDADFSKNFSIEAGKPEIIADIDSLFYHSGTSGFSAQTIYGLAKCQVQNDGGSDKNELLCEGEENAAGSWSVFELTSKNECDPYMPCKRKDTIHIYIRGQNEPANTALRIPKSVVIPIQSGIFTWNDINSLAYFRNPDLQSTNISWSAAGLNLSALLDGTNSAASSEGSLSVAPISQNEGVDTLFFNLSSSQTDSYKVLLHLADTASILKNAIPQTPSDTDTVFNTGYKKYIALPKSSKSGNIYTYDIVQSDFDGYAEIAGDYLHILKVEFEDITLLYTEDGLLKQRRITLNPESKASPEDTSPIVSQAGAKGVSIRIFNGAISLDALPEGASVKIYDLRGMLFYELPRTEKSAITSALPAGIYIVQVKAKGVNWRKAMAVR